MDSVLLSPGHPITMTPVKGERQERAKEILPLNPLQENTSPYPNF